MTSPGWNPTNRSELRFPGRIRLPAKPNERRGIALDGRPLRILSSRRAVARTKVQLGQDYTPCDVHQAENRGSASHLRFSLSTPEELHFHWTSSGPGHLRQEGQRKQLPVSRFELSNSILPQSAYGRIHRVSCGVPQIPATSRFDWQNLWDHLDGHTGHCLPQRDGPPLTHIRQLAANKPYIQRF